MSAAPESDRFPLDATLNDQELDEQNFDVEQDRPNPPPDSRRHPDSRIAPSKSSKPFSTPRGAATWWRRAWSWSRLVLERLVLKRLVLERIAPVRKGRPVFLDLPTVRTASDIAAAMATLTAAMAAGEVTPDEAATVASVFEMRRKALETEELERRPAALEEKEMRK